VWLGSAVVNELVLNLKNCLCRGRVQHCDLKEDFFEHFPIIYTPRYNIWALGLEKLHPFDINKYKRIYADLKQTNYITDEMKIWQPSVPSREFLQEVMSPLFLFKMNYSTFVCMWVEVPPAIILPAWVIRFCLLNPMGIATRGSVDAACMAHRKGWAINLAGGYHHANANWGEGFCIFPDITLVAKYMEKWFEYKRICIIDLDAHQGNGYERDLPDKSKYYIIDAYNHNVYPNDWEGKKAITEDIEAYYEQSDDEYLTKVEGALMQCYQSFKPDFLIYNAGTDTLSGDPLGHLNQSRQAIVDRDEIVFRFALEVMNCPIAMLMSGGY